MSQQLRAPFVGFHKGIGIFTGKEVVVSLGCEVFGSGGVFMQENGLFFLFLPDLNEFQEQI